jgi:hypothetical protein
MAHVLLQLIFRWYPFDAQLVVRVEGECRFRAVMKFFPHSQISPSSVSESGVVLTFVTNVAMGLISVPTPIRPSADASTSVVPPPTNGSKIVSPGWVKARIVALANAGENLAGYL